MYYINLDEHGYVASYYTVDGSTEPIPGVLSVESLDDLDLTGSRLRAHRWDGEKLVLDKERLAQLEAEAQAAERIAELREMLAATDYVAAKIAEGSATHEEYANVIARRRAWRAEINELEGTA